MFYLETRGRFGKWTRGVCQSFKTVPAASDAANTEIVEGFETIDTVRIVDEEGNVIDPVNHSDLWYNDAGDLMEGPCPKPLRLARGAA